MKIIAHRGASNLKPENTLESIKKAMELNADWIEIDIRITKDQNPVIIHDPQVNRTTNGQGLVKEMNISEIKKLDAGGGEAPPHLEEVLQLVNGKLPLILELKVPDSFPIISEYLRNYDLEKIMIASFYHKRLLEIKEIESEIKTGAIFYGGPVKLHEIALNCKCEYIFPHKDFLDILMVDECHDHQIKLYPWVVDHSNELKGLKEMGVDGIVTNRIEKWAKNDIK
ncbi:MAG: hypothetical protein KKF16_02005 [Euryarchaeota archaeon]|nr:hypothetical protein [Euryarchaeota archaeon]MBV1730211.1 hypothetical protein [Methanobacterium sp.]MBU4548202.1 hypothetical protein [Euryarchaeota archaeon]MBU4608584.1 hypothetical protein [Euryarchaeota archaeon]MBV1754600.1 hypothetical protein [Methanobacterium sp.]